MHKVMSGKVPHSLAAKSSLNQSRHSGKLNIPIPRTDLSKSRLVYSGSVLWNSLPDTLRLQSCTETFKSPYLSYVTHPHSPLSHNYYVWCLNRKRNLFHVCTGVS